MDYSFLSNIAFWTGYTTQLSLFILVLSMIIVLWTRFQLKSVFYIGFLSSLFFSISMAIAYGSMYWFSDGIVAHWQQLFGRSAIGFMINTLFFRYVDRHLQSKNFAPKTKF